MTLGNHEFDWGEERIISNQEMMNFPLLSCNTFYSRDKNLRPEWLEPYTIIERDGLQIGIIGYARTDMGSSIDEQFGGDFYFPSPFSYIKDYSRQLRLSYNCDLILSVGHDEGPKRRAPFPLGTFVRRQRRSHQTCRPPQKAPRLFVFPRQHLPPKPLALKSQTSFWSLAEAIESNAFTPICCPATSSRLSFVSRL